MAKAKAKRKKIKEKNIKKKKKEITKKKQNSHPVTFHTQLFFFFDPTFSHSFNLNAISFLLFNGFAFNKRDMAMIEKYEQRR